MDAIKNELNKLKEILMIECGDNVIGVRIFLNHYTTEVSFETWYKNDKTVNKRNIRGEWVEGYLTQEEIEKKESGNGN